MWNWSIKKAPVELIHTLKVMLGQLNHERLEVGLAAAYEAKHSGHKIRTVQNENPWWYQKLCSRHTVSRSNGRKRLGKKHHDTKISRRRIIQALTTLSSGKPARSIYAEELIELAVEQAALWEEEKEEYGDY